MNQTMRYGSVCSGIEAASVAWQPLGWDAAFFSEIEPLPCAVLAARYPTVPNLGDMTKYASWQTAEIDILVGGTPCQSFSVAGLRKGLADPRGNLTLTYAGIVDRYRPRWLVWENVPGVLSDKSGAFGAFLGALGSIGYGFAYRVLDAQYFGVPQRRRRVFVVGYLGDWRRAAAVLFERESLSRNPPPRRKAGEGITCRPTGISGNVSSKWAKGTGGPEGDEHYNLIAFPAFMSGTQCASAENLSPALGSRNRTAVAIQGSMIGRGEKSVPRGCGYDVSGSCFTLTKTDQHAVALPVDGLVRRLTPRECERLQGFPDDYTLVECKGKLAADGARYKAIGNSMAVPVMRWIGERIQAVELLSETHP